MFDVPGSEEDARQKNLASKLAANASRLGREIVDMAGVLDMIAADSRVQEKALAGARSQAAKLLDANRKAEASAQDVRARAEETLSRLDAALAGVGDSAPVIRSLAGWVADLMRRVEHVETMLSGVTTSNGVISGIATQVNILAINAKIEAARAGEAGKSFAVVAEAVNELSRETAKAAREIDGQVRGLTEWLGVLQAEANDYGPLAEKTRQSTAALETSLAAVAEGVRTAHREADTIVETSAAANRAGLSLSPILDDFGTTFTRAQAHIETAHRSVRDLVDASERIVQGTVAIGGTHEDGVFIERVRADAGRISARLEAAVDTGRISGADLFSDRYIPIPGTNPQQFSTPFTQIADTDFPEIQEAALSFDPRVVFCAAVDRNGYLPTHNRKFSHPPGPDPVWNAAHCRNRRIFDDRVGLKAGRNRDPFLLQVYRRDMGGGEFRTMKDLSAPIFVHGRHWGGLRLAYSF